MATFKELFGDKYDPAMTLGDAEKIFEGKRLADLSTGEYVAKAKYDADTAELTRLQALADGKQAEIDKAVAKAVEDAKRAAKAEYDKALENERTAQKKARAKGKAYEGLTEEQKSIYDAFIKEEELVLSDDGETFKNFEELAKPVREKFKSAFPADPDGSNGRGGLPPVGENGAGAGVDAPFHIFDLEKFKNKKS